MLRPLLGCLLQSLSARRAWIEIGLSFARKIRYVSLSARRAWIEIASCRRVSGRALVALRKESVDRNCLRYRNRLPNIPVALRKESVDRNARASSLAIRSCGRSPQGERG